MVLCDQLMPDIKGSDILGKLRQAGVQVPFILCSAQVDAKDENFREQMGDDFISKPVESPELIQKIRRYL